MAEDVAVTLQEQEVVRGLLRELNQELALADHYRFKNQKLLEALPSFKKEKGDALADDYRKAIEELNHNAARNTQDESYLMNDFSREIQEFNGTLVNFSAILKILKKQAEAKD